MKKKMCALSIRQPYAEQILKGIKKIEYRSRPASKRRRVYIYASLCPGDERGLDLPRGFIVGTVEISGCRKIRNYYGWELSKPKRLKYPRKPKNQPMPVWFYPF